MILICYDDSPDAMAAIEHGAEFLRGEATVLTVWRPFIEVVADVPWGSGMSPGGVDSGAIDKAAREHAQQRAEKGAQLARAAGLDAQPTVRAEEKGVAETILAEADALGASAILMGARGLTGLKSMLLGSVSHAVIQHADRAVIVVPSPDVAAARHRAVHPEP